MARCLMRRLVLALPVLIGVTIFTFFLIRVIPGDVVDVKFGTNIRPEEKQALLKQLRRPPRPAWAGNEPCLTVKHRGHYW